MFYEDLTKRVKGAKIIIYKNSFNPLEEGFEKHIGIENPFNNHYRKSEGEGCFHCIEFDDYYEIHYDKFDPRKKPIQHFDKDLNTKQKAIIGSIFAFGAICVTTVAGFVFKKLFKNDE